MSQRRLKSNSGAKLFTQELVSLAEEIEEVCEVDERGGQTHDTHGGGHLGVSSEWYFQLRHHRIGPGSVWTNTEAINNSHSYLLAVPADVEVGDDRGAGDREHLVVGVAGHPSCCHQQRRRQEAEGGVNDGALDHLATLDEVAEEDGDADDGQQAQSAAANNLGINLEHETMDRMHPTPQPQTINE